MDDVTRPEPGTGGLPVVRLRDEHGAADVAVQGAHVLSWVPAGGTEVLWLSPLSTFAEGTAVRGGVPICFPWFAGGPDGTSRPSHGYARVRPWEVVSTRTAPQGTTLTMALPGDPAADAWGRTLAATFRVHLGAALTLELEIRNDGADPVAVESALHTYLAVSDVRQVQVHGLGGAAYLDKLGGPELVRQVEPVLRLDGETDRVYQGTDATVTVVDPAAGRRISVAKSGSASTVVWNPWTTTGPRIADLGDGWPSMLCVETANVNQDAVHLAPGGSTTMSCTLTTAPLA